ncbi:MAG: SurA N-terminal domain-containing protein [Beijerinckiaceae bacterium]
MLDALRAATQSLPGRIIIGLISLCFVGWGVSSAINSFVTSSQFVRVGNTDIGVGAYREAYQRALQNLQQQRQQAITNEQARELGLDRQVLVQLVSDAILDQQAKSLGLAMSDKDLARSLLEDDRFKGTTGKFDRLAFDARLRNAGTTERRFVTELRRDYLRREQTLPLEQGLQVPNALLEVMNRYVNETRSIDYFVLLPAAAGTIDSPNDEALKAFYDVRRDSYRTPEYRKIVVLALTPSALEKATTVSEEEVTKRYEDVKAQRYAQPEKRKIDQILLPDEAAANAASAKIDAGESFDQLAAERSPADKYIDLGALAKPELADKAIAEVAFALPEGAVSKPVKLGQFGWALVRVEKIIPAHDTPFEQVKADLEKELAQTKVRREISKLRDEIEDRRASGKTLAEAAVGTTLTPRTIEAIDANGRDKDGQPVADLREAQALLKAVFASDVGVDNEPIESRDGGMLWFEIGAIEPARQRTLEEVKPQVEQAWQEEERGRRLATKAADLVKKLGSGEKLEAIAAAEGNLEVKHNSSVKRSGTTGLTQTATAQIFNVGVDSAGSAPAEGGGRLIFQVLDASVQPIDIMSADFSKLADQVKAALANDVLTEYLGDLRGQMGVSVNQRALQTALGSPADNQADNQ